MTPASMQVLDIVRDSPGITAARIAERLGVCDRTVRTYIKGVNDCLNGIATITCKGRSGYELMVQDPVGFASWEHRLENPTSTVAETPDERMAFLVNDLLCRSDWVTVDDLSSFLFVSRATISADLKRVEDYLARFDMSLERKPCHGVRIRGSEMSRRICLADSVVGSLVRKHGGGIHNQARLDGIARIVDDVLERCSWSINSLVYQNLLVHIAISLARIEAGCLIPPDDELLAKIKGSRAFEVAVCLASEVEREFSVDLPESEAAYIAIHLMGKQCTSPESVDGKSAADDSIVVDDDVWSAVESMLSVVNKIYRYDFRDDLELRMNLARHIVPLAVRIKYGMQADNPVLGDIRTHYPLAYAMALDSSFVLAEVYGGTLSEDEVGYIALAFALAIERKKTVRERKNILIVCATGHAGAGMLERLYRQQFGMYLNHIYTCDVSNVERFDFTKVDYVFTTVPLDFNPPVMVREVSFFLDDSDVAPVAGLLASDGAGFHAGRSFSERIPDDLFFERLQAASKSDVIDRMC